MSRRKSSGDQEFGSDSFLDIIANIVGILIILIVVAGVKVARQPTDLTDSDVTVSTVQAVQPEAVGTDVVPTDEGQDPAWLSTETGPSGSEENTSPGVSSDVQTAIESLHEPPPQQDELAELDRQIAELTLQLDRKQSETATTEAELHEVLALIDEQENAERLDASRAAALAQEKSRLTQTVQSLQVSLVDTRNRVEAFETTLTSLSRRQTYISEALQQVAVETQQLREVLDDAEASLSAGERLQHRLSPVGRPVTDDELHFRLSQGRIAYIPIEGLLARMKEQVTSRRDVVLRFHRHEGLVGPVGGFNMKYTVQRDSPSPLQSLQSGGNVYRIAIAGWTILPADTLSAEPVDDALRIGSRFRQVLEATAPDTSITVWLYPDDFKHFGRLRELAHSLNLRVAARPLPEGTPISGSPRGSRSTSQ